jgi:hypothetical protein
VKSEVLRSREVSATGNEFVDTKILLGWFGLEGLGFTAVAACIQLRALMHRKFHSHERHVPPLFERRSDPAPIDAVPLRVWRRRWHDELDRQSSVGLIPPNGPPALHVLGCSIDAGPAIAVRWIKNFHGLHVAPPLVTFRDLLCALLGSQHTLNSLLSTEATLSNSTPLLSGVFLGVSK